MMWTVTLDYGITIGTYHGVGLEPDAMLWEVPPHQFKRLMKEACSLLPWLSDFQYARWCWQGGKTATEIYEEATKKLSHNSLAPSLLQVFQKNLVRKKGSHSKVTRQSSRAGCVYLLKGGGYYKIGCTSDLTKRVAQISPKLPFEVETVCRIPTDDCYELEEYLHSLYSGKQTNGEWFELDEDDVEYIRGLVDEQNDVS